MATPNIAPSVVHLYNSTRIPPALQFPAQALPAITQLELAAVCSLRNRARQLEGQVMEAEQSIRVRLESGSDVEEGERSVGLKESFRRNVSWREVSERLADRLYGNGKADGYCERVLRSTRPSRTVSLVLL